MADSISDRSAPETESSPHKTCRTAPAACSPPSPLILGFSIRQIARAVYGQPAIKPWSIREHDARHFGSDSHVNPPLAIPLAWSEMRRAILLRDVMEARAIRLFAGRAVVAIGIASRSVADCEAGRGLPIWRSELLFALTLVSVYTVASENLARRYKFAGLPSGVGCWVCE